MAYTENKNEHLGTTRVIFSNLPFPIFSGLNVLNSLKVHFSGGSPEQQEIMKINSTTKATWDFIGTEYTGQSLTL